MDPSSPSLIPPLPLSHPSPLPLPLLLPLPPPADTVVSAEIVPPIQIVGNQLPARLQLVFKVTTATRIGSTFTGDLTYMWDFGDGRVLANAAASEPHQYLHAGEYSVRCVVTSLLGSVSDSLNISVYEGGIHCAEWCNTV